MTTPAQGRLLNRFTTSTVVLAVALPGSLLALTAAPAAAAPLPATYSASAQSDIVDLDLDLLGEELAGVQIGHSLSTVASTAGGGTSTGTSANLGGSLVGTDLVLDEETVTAPPTANPDSRTLLPVGLAPAATIGAVTGDVRAAWTSASSCVPADANGFRVLSDASTTLAGVELASLPLGLGTLADVEASSTRTRTFLDDAGTGGSDVVSRATTTIGDISLLGDAVAVDVTSPVVLEARSDGTTASAAYTNPPTVTVAVDGGQPITIPSTGQPQPVSLPLVLDTLVDLTITAYPAQDQSSGATGQADVDALLRIDLDVLDVGILDAASVSLGIAPMSVSATAPSGGVECGTADTTPPAAPVITTPANGAVTDDATPTFEGTAEADSTVVVRAPGGAEVCTAIADTNGAWSCTPGAPLPDGQATYTATATDAAGNTSPAAGTTFTIDTTAPAITIFTPADGSATTDLTPDVTGVSEAGAQITVTEGGLPVCSTTASSTGAWSCTPAAPLIIGQHTFTVTAEDAAGNTADSTTTFAVVVVGGGDTVAPAAPDITTPAAGSTTNDTTPLIAGTGEAGATVTVSEGSTVLCTAVVGANASWSCSPALPLTIGAHTVIATQTDPSGNTSPTDSTSFTVVAVPGNGGGGNGGGGDTDGDGLPDTQEVAIGTDPLVQDTDKDGLTDGAEVNVHKTDPLVKDTDKDGLTDGQEVKGVKIRHRFQICGKKNRKVIKVTTDPLRKDTDRDGLKDGKEVKGYKIKQRVKTRKGTFVIGKVKSDPTRKDTDRDGLKDKVEKTGKANKRFGKAKSDPSKCDTDKGGISDGAEIRARSNPSDVKSGPRRPLGRTGFGG